MAIVVRNTNYNGEVLEKILGASTTGNDLVEKGLTMVIPWCGEKNQPAAYQDGQDAPEA
ncbi:hypothetical protein NXW11_24765 [Bacteroides thetaiotaomicron]|nr:hypothetical protein [Bacteroides thetaiotaomicron]